MAQSSSYTSLPTNHLPAGSVTESANSASVSAYDQSAGEETPLRSSLWAGELARLHAPRGFNYKDDMDVFSPLVEVQPITPSFDKLFEGIKNEFDKKTSLLFPSSKRLPLATDVGSDPQSIFDWKPPSTMDDSRTPISQPISFPIRTDEPSSITPPEAWGGERVSDKFARPRQQVTLPSRFATLSSSSSIFSGSMMTGLQNPSLPSIQTGINFQIRDNSFSQESPLAYSDVPFGSTSVTLGMQGNLESSGLALTQTRRFSSYAERISTNPSFSDATVSAVGSLKVKKSEAETKEEHVSSFSSKNETLVVAESGIPSSMNGMDAQSHKTPLQPNSQQGSSFSLQLFQGTLDEALGSFQKSIHEDVKNLHIEVLRQFHMQEVRIYG
ncbi:protein NEDD1-like isoform X2 [Rutidosis leptorrhynchoides]|uniref:protein NEDD1-like isoform X2 n=1 Tax=Rutidosis leptorrhynchoides TaxID=125765 RepID=UPI003A991F59